MAAKNIVSFISGVLFAIGLALAGMTQPNKVMSFLDWSPAWNPSLLFVMGGAVTFNLIAFRLIMRRTKPLFDETFHIPQRTQITKPLVLGSLIFGVGWGLSGFCPGPAFVSTCARNFKALVFVACMLVGMKLFQVLRQKVKLDL